MPIYDHDNMFADKLAYGGTPTVVEIPEHAGPGTPLRVFCKGDGITSITGIVVTDGATSGAATDALETIVCTDAELNAGITFELPETVNKFVKVALDGGPAAGVWTCGLVLGGGQSNN